MVAASQGAGPQLEVRGNQVELTWIVQPWCVGDRVYAGVGMAADSRHHRHGGPGEEGYDGWVVFQVPATKMAGSAAVSCP